MFPSKKAIIIKSENEMTIDNEITYCIDRKVIPTKRLKGL
jgi:hypothetical protein